jgi:hypothetical protein
MSKTVYLVVEDLSTVVDGAIIELFNSRHVGLGSLSEGATYADMKALKESLVPIKGAGSIKLKDGAEYWVLPFYNAGGDVTLLEDGVFILSATGLKDFGWDVIEEDIEGI